MEKEKIIELLEQIANEDEFESSDNVTKTQIEHEAPQDLYCLSVPGKAFYIKSNGKVSVTGNSLHCESMVKLFREFISENKAVWDDELKSEIYSIAEKMVELEDKFIDLAFSLGPMKDLTPEDVKKYIRYIADRRLISLGMKGIFKVKKNPLPWVEGMLGVTHANFFEARSTDYSKGSLSGSWMDVWA